MRSLAGLSAVLICIGLGSFSSASRTPYILNGHDVDEPGKYPWMASLQYAMPGVSGQLCGASLISERWLVTARHCVKGPRAGTYERKPSEIKVILGAHDILTKKQGDPQWYEVEEIITHPQCHATDWLACDFSLIKLATDADVSSPYIQPVAIADKGEVFDQSEKCVITGWGKSAMKTNVLQELEVKVLEQRDCFYKSFRKQFPLVCTLPKDRGVSAGAKPGDSGGPVSCRKNGQWKVIGVSSIIFDVAPGTYVDMWADISRMRDWVTEHTGI